MLEGVVLGGFLVELDAEAGGRGQGEAGAGEFRDDREEVGGGVVVTGEAIGVAGPGAYEFGPGSEQEIEPDPEPTALLVADELPVMPLALTN